ncbi:MAG: hypothetical protein ABIU06_04755 [Anaerolineales bacterium]
METNSNQSSSVPKIVGGIVAVLVCCACALIVGAGFVLYQAGQGLPVSLTPFIPPTENTVTPAPTVELERPPTDSISTETLETLGQSLVPENDPYELACRLEGKCNIPETLPSGPFQVGEQGKFWVTNVDTAGSFQVDASLVYLTDQAYFWVEDGVDFDQNDAEALVDAFSNEMVPINREFFGTEALPGIDEDPHIYLLYARGIGGSVAGYFSSPDAFHPQAHEFSNAHEMFVFNADNSPLDDQYTFGVLAHEFQHMIHANYDRNETSWINEGFSELAVLLNDYYAGGADDSYIINTDSEYSQLNDWGDDPGTNGPHYGSAFLFVTYFLDRFGEDATKALVKDSANGFDSVDAVLEQISATDPLTGEAIHADDFFMDWVVTNFLLDESVADGRYLYHNYPSASQANSTEAISSCPQSAIGREVHQYSVDYIEINCTGDFTLKFSGSTVVGLLPTNANSGKYSFWSNKGDESDMTLTREFDFTNVSGPITLSFAMWYDLETDYDYVFLETSTDGEIWEILTTPSGTGEDPSGNSYGWGYNGQTNDWKTEEVDLSEFAGQTVQIRFEYVTDAAVNGEGLLLDDVQVDAINYQSDFEADEGGWIPSGFVRVENVLPQTYRLSLILKGDSTTVTNIPLNADQTVDIPLSLKSGEEAILIVAGTTRFTRLPAAYQIEIK